MTEMLHRLFSLEQFTGVLIIARFHQLLGNGPPVDL